MWCPSEGLLGNRDYLSEGDLFQVNDMYQCKDSLKACFACRKDGSIGTGTNSRQTGTHKYGAHLEVQHGLEEG